ncbi:MAG: hypothetical protein ACYTEY_06000, partial [Planctomycetota bacterium]
MMRLAAARFIVGAVLAVGSVASVCTADVIRLKSGAVIQGTVVKRSDQKVWLDVGPTILEFRMDDVEEVEVAAAEVATEIETGSIFHTARNLSQLSPRAQAKRVGPAVIKVATPGGLGSGVILNADGYAVTNAHVIQGETNLR